MESLVGEENSPYITSIYIMRIRWSIIQNCTQIPDGHSYLPSMFCQILAITDVSQPITFTTALGLCDLITIVPSNPHITFYWIHLQRPTSAVRAVMNYRAQKCDKFIADLRYTCSPAQRQHGKDNTQNMVQEINLSSVSVQQHYW